MRFLRRTGWNAGNGIVFGSALIPHIDTTATALIALTAQKDAVVVQGLNWLRRASLNCASAYSLAWSAIAFSVHRDPPLDDCISKLSKALSTTDGISNIETLSLAAIALKTAAGLGNPFTVAI